MKKIIIILIIVMLLTSCSPKLYKAAQGKKLMGTDVEITVLDYNYTKAKMAINVAFEEIERIDNLINIKNLESEVSILNKEKSIKNPSEDLLFLLRKANEFSEMSDGAFDITIMPIIDLYSESFEKDREPAHHQIQDTLRNVNYKNVYYDNNLAALSGEKTKISLNGLLKGYALDRATNILEKYEIKHALININGDLKTIGKKTEQEDWQIALQNPSNPLHFITILLVNDKSVTTSGDYRLYFDENKKYHHIINPKTGYSATDLVSVTIIGDNALQADGLATTVFVLGPKEGLKLVESIDEVEALLITSNRDILRSSGFKY